MISASIEIDAPPALVREIILDFANLTSWHKSGVILSVDMVDTSKKHGSELVEGDKCVTRVAGMTITQTVLNNDDTEYQTVGPWMGLLTGTHSYQYIPLPIAHSTPSHSIEPSSSTTSASTSDQTPSPSKPRPSLTSNPNKTLLTQAEEFHGLLSFMMRPNMMGGKNTLVNFEKINEELRVKCEEVWRERRGLSRRGEGVGEVVGGKAVMVDSATQTQEGKEVAV